MIKVPAEVYSRVVGYYRPVNQWNKGKQAEFDDRLHYRIPEVVSDAGKDRRVSARQLHGEGGGDQFEGAREVSRVYGEATETGVGPGVRGEGGKPEAEAGEGTEGVCGCVAEVCL